VAFKLVPSKETLKKVKYAERHGCGGLMSFFANIHVGENSEETEEQSLVKRQT
jgi:hypothetical protein